jgi:hypothetical protein
VKIKGAEIEEAEVAVVVTEEIADVMTNLEGNGFQVFEEILGTEANEDGVTRIQNQDETVLNLNPVSLALIDQDVQDEEIKYSSKPQGKCIGVFDFDHLVNI